MNRYLIETIKNGVSDYGTHSKNASEVGTKPADKRLYV